MEIEAQWRKPIQRPIGVYIWTALVAIKFGIVNFVGYFMAIRATDGDANLALVVVTFSLCLFSLGAAIWAFTGDDVGRIALIILTPLNIIWALLLVLPIFLSVNSSEEERSTALNVIIQQVFLSLWIIGMIWYFVSKKVVDYYKQDAHSN
jgi:hypothetical protein